MRTVLAAIDLGLEGVLQQLLFLHIGAQSRILGDQDESILEGKQRLAEQGPSQGIVPCPELHAKEVRRSRGEVKTGSEMDGRSQAHVRLEGHSEDVGQLGNAETPRDASNASDIGLHSPKPSPLEQLEGLVPID